MKEVVVHYEFKKTSGERGFVLFREIEYKYTFCLELKWFFFPLCPCFCKFQIKACK